MESKIEQGRMYQIIVGVTTEVVRHGDALVPVTDPIVRELLGQQVLELYE